jgi:aerobic-type carbon monoxide dehydrogenase small subunit (CoxS/CutS family)
LVTSKAAKNDTRDKNMHNCSEAKPMQMIKVRLQTIPRTRKKGHKKECGHGSRNACTVSANNHTHLDPLSEDGHHLP